MATSTRFAVGVHLLTTLAANPGKILRSEDVADSANTNPVAVRRLFSLMTAAKFNPRSARSGSRFRIGAAGERQLFARRLRGFGERRAVHRAPAASERILPGWRPYPS
jgi:hypothetical protein